MCGRDAAPQEFTRAARLWTHGYDMYTPNKDLVFHDYDLVRARSITVC